MTDESGQAEELSLTDALEAAWEQHEAGDEPVQEVEHAPDEGLQPAQEATEAPADAPEPAADETGVRPAQELQEGQPAPEQGAADAPMSLPPAAREAWKDTPQAVREAIAKREADYEAGIVKYSENAKRAEQMDQVLGPFQQFFAMDGNNMPQTITGLLQTASLLQMGAPQQRAAAAADIISRFGVDINLLADAIDGRGAQAPSQPAQLGPQDIQAMVQQGVQQGIQGFQQQQSVSSAEADLQAFRDSKPEFYDDVAGLMADIIEVRARRGEQMTYQEAYDTAIGMRPDIQAILQARQSAPTPAQRAAATSISSPPGGIPAPEHDGPQTMHDQLSEAWDMHQGPAIGRI